MGIQSDPSKIVPATPAAAGCWVDGHWGQYGAARVIELAAGVGYPGTDGDIEIAARHMLECTHPGTDSGLTDADWSVLADTGPVEDWLNINVAPEGYSFGWLDGEFFLQSAEWWAEES